ncbi:MAG: class I SAM-dependent methyltransferase [Promethearchaeota archaeon]|jgi:ubiquinone/menaquinone biosynthesis C-methylase UbiE
MLFVSYFSKKFSNFVFKKRYEGGMYNEVAEEINSRIKSGSVLDIGTGGGYLLKSLHDLNPNLELYAIDINKNMVEISKRNLLKYVVPATILKGSIEKTDLDDHFFDIVTCSSSFSYWENPAACLNEIYRILKPIGAGILWEPYKELDIDELKEAINEHLKDATRIRRFFAIKLNIFGLKYGHRFGLKLYSFDDLSDILKQSKFADNFNLVKTSLIDSPIFVRIELTKD